MSGRRGHRRLTIGTSTSGAVRLLRDVAIERIEHQELVAISQTPAVIGEEMFLELFSGNGCIGLQVRVLDSRPVVNAASMRHRLRVMVLTAGALATESNRLPLADSLLPPGIA
jgi:hypothetical protein